MADRPSTRNSPLPFDPDWNRLRRWALGIGAAAAAALVALLLTWNAFFVYVPPGKHLVIVAKNGAPLRPGHVLAGPGEQGVQEEVKGEGWHFVMPVAYVTELEENTVIKPGMVGVVTALGGETPPNDQTLAKPGQKGVLRDVLPPGTYRLNLHGYSVQEVPATKIDAGQIGVLRRRRLAPAAAPPGPAKPVTPVDVAHESDQQPAAGPSAAASLGKIESSILQPGLYYLNPEEYEVLLCQVGIFQTTFHYDEDPTQSSAITFRSNKGFQISMDCTVEWELRPEHMPALIAEYGARSDIERKVIDMQAHSIGRDKGVNYPVQSFLEGTKREEFQNDFTQQLTKVCEEKNVVIRSAFIRNIVIPDDYLKQIRDKQIAAETEITKLAEGATAVTNAEVEKERQMVEQRVAIVAAETRKLVAAKEQEVANAAANNKAEIEKLAADFNAQIAELDAERTKLTGSAEAEVKGMAETAKAGIYQMKLALFQGDGDAFARATLAEKLNPKLLLRVFHSGPGTFWTNLGDKNVNLMVPAAAGEPAKK